MKQRRKTELLERLMTMKCCVVFVCSLLSRGDQLEVLQRDVCTYAGWMFDFKG